MGVIANLAIYFASTRCSARVDDVGWGPVHLQVPEPDTVNWVSLVIGVVAAVLLFRARWSVLRTLAACAGLGVAAALAARAAWS